MKTLKKYHFLIYPIIFSILWLIVHILLGYESSGITFGTITCLTYLLSPKYKSYTTQSGKYTQVTWLFFKDRFTE